MKKRVRDPDYAGLGRNCELFERLRPMSYSLVRKFWLPGGFDHFKDAMRALADDLNAAFAVPLPVAEVKAIAASCARWVWKHFDPAAFREIQSRRGARKGAAKRDALMPEVLRLIGEGRSQREVAAAVGASQMTICNWLKGQGE
ncbi:MAG TPA: primase C-terminal domain-containing protein [Alicycliphilus sp.]|nr:primase C-terminal domain-containing protein [Alicycliphilus sp.]